MPTPNDHSEDAIAQKRDAFIERLLRATRGTFETFSIYIGVRLGFYGALAAGRSLTSAELASRTGTSARFSREWLEQQTVAGILEVDDEKAEAPQRRFSLPAAYVEVLVDQDSLNYLAPLTRLVAGAVYPLASVLEAYRTDGGVPYADYGIELREGQAGINRAMFLKQLGREWLPAMPDVHARLMAAPQLGSPTLGAGWDGRASAWPRAIQECPWTASTWTSHRSSSPAPTLGCGSYRSGVILRARRRRSRARRALRLGDGPRMPARHVATHPCPQDHAAAGR